MCWGQWQRGLVSLPFRRGSGPVANSSSFPGNIITKHHITSHHIISHHITSHHITSHHITSYHVTSHHITSHHITSHHITSHHIMLHLVPRYHFFNTKCAKGGDSTQLGSQYIDAHLRIYKYADTRTHIYSSIHTHKHVHTHALSYRLLTYASPPVLETKKSCALSPSTWAS